MVDQGVEGWLRSISAGLQPTGVCCSSCYLILLFNRRTDTRGIRYYQGIGSKTRSAMKPLSPTNPAMNNRASDDLDFGCTWVLGRQSRCEHLRVDPSPKRAKSLSPQRACTLSPSGCVRGRGASCVSTMHCGLARRRNRCNQVHDYLWPDS